MKKTAVLVLVAVILLSCVFSFSSCSLLEKIGLSSVVDEEEKEDASSIELPDVSGLDEETCKALLLKKGLIPKIEYEYSDTVAEGVVTRTEPAVGSYVAEDDIIVVYISKGDNYYEATNAVGYMSNISGVEGFVWGEGDEKGTKGFYAPFICNEYFYMPMFFVCKSNSTLSFYGTFAVASTNENFSSSIPADIVDHLDVYANITHSSDESFMIEKEIDNTGEVAKEFYIKIPMESLGNKKPSNIYIKFDVLVGGVRQEFQAGFDIAW